MPSYRDSYFKKYPLRDARHVADVIYNLMRRQYDSNLRIRMLECNINLTMTDAEFKYLSGRKTLKKSFITDVQEMLSKNQIRLDMDFNTGGIRCQSLFDTVDRNHFASLRDLEMAVSAYGIRF